MSKEKLTRREFLKFSTASLVSTGLNILPIRSLVEPFSAKENLNYPVSAKSITYWQYDGGHKYQSGETTMTPALFKAQMDYLGQRGYHTVSDNQLAEFIEGDMNLPYNTVALGIKLNQGKSSYDKEQLLEMMSSLSENKLHAILFIDPDQIGSTPGVVGWGDLAKWYNSGLISLGAFGFDEKNLSDLDFSQRYQEVRRLKRTIEERMANAKVANLKVLGLASSKESNRHLVFARKAGYRFALGGNIKAKGNEVRDNLVIFDRFNLPTLAPYSTKATLRKMGYSSQNNPMLTPLISEVDDKRTFGEIISHYQTPVYSHQLNQAQEVKMGDKIEEPREGLGRKLFQDGLVIVHTTGRKDDNPWSWMSETAYKSLGRKAVHFTVGHDGVVQLSPIYKDRYGKVWFPMIEHGGAWGVNEWGVSIELAGSNYDKYLNRKKSEHYEVIRRITDNATNLIVDLMKLTGWDIDRVVGHLEVSFRGKSDPGVKYIDYLRSKLVQNLTG